MENTLAQILNALFLANAQAAQLTQELEQARARIKELESAAPEAPPAPEPQAS